MSIKTILPDRQKSENIMMIKSLWHKLTSINIFKKKNIVSIDMDYLDVHDLCQIANMVLKNKMIENWITVYSVRGDTGDIEYCTIKYFFVDSVSNKIAAETGDSFYKYVFIDREKLTDLLSKQR